MRRHLAAAFAVLPFLLAGPARAAESPLLDKVKDLLNGCYGAVVTVCDPYVSGNPVETDPMPVPVCAGSCSTYNVPVPVASGERTCVGWSDHNGSTTERCLGSRPDS